MSASSAARTPSPLEVLPPPAMRPPQANVVADLSGQHPEVVARDAERRERLQDGLPASDGVAVQGFHEPRTEGLLDGAFVVHVTFDGSRDRGRVQGFCEGAWMSARNRADPPRGHESTSGHLARTAPSMRILTISLAFCQEPMSSSSCQWMISRRG